jgi:hypothetical protein
MFDGADSFTSTLSTTSKWALMSSFASTYHFIEGKKRGCPGGNICFMLFGYMHSLIGMGQAAASFGMGTENLWVSERR